MPITNSQEKLGYKAWISKSKDFISIEEVPNVYYEFEVNFYPEEVEQEMTDEEIMNLPAKTGVFSFLSDREEDIYNESDGKALQ